MVLEISERPQDWSCTAYTDDIHRFCCKTMCVTCHYLVIPLIHPHTVHMLLMPSIIMVFLKDSEDVDMMIDLLQFHEQAVVCIIVKNDRTASKHHNFF